jgi:hypothetical protein
MRMVQPTPMGEARKRPACRRSAFWEALPGQSPFPGRQISSAAPSGGDPPYSASSSRSTVLTRRPT